MKNNEILIINKDNYKGYIELLKTRLNKESENRKLRNKNAVKYTIDGTIGTLIVTFLGLKLLIFNGLSFNLSLCTLGTLGAYTIIYLVKDIKIKKKINEDDCLVQNDYSNININFTTEELVDALYAAKIIEMVDCDFDHDYYYYKVGKWNIEEYEKKIKVEEEFEKYLEETKYDGYVINPPITQEELDKPKVRKLTR